MKFYKWAMNTQTIIDMGPYKYSDDKMLNFQNNYYNYYYYHFYDYRYTISDSYNACRVILCFKQYRTSWPQPQRFEHSFLIAIMHIARVDTLLTNTSVSINAEMELLKLPKLFSEMMEIMSMEMAEVTHEWLSSDTNDFWYQT